jgi:hypothetical protein
MSQRSPVAQHIVKAAETIDGAASEFAQGLNSLNSKIKTLQEQASRPTAFQPEDLSAELATLDTALSHLQNAGGLLRGAASAVENAGGSADMSSVLGQGQGTAATGGGTPAPTAPTSGSSETGPANSQTPSVDPNQVPQPETVSGDDFTDTSATDASIDGPQESPGEASPTAPANGGNMEEKGPFSG